MNTLVQYSYVVAAILFIYGLKELSSPATARRAIGTGRYCADRRQVSAFERIEDAPCADAFSVGARALGRNRD